MIKSVNAYIHVGYPKTATTTLQSAMFAALPGFVYVGKPLTDVDNDMQKIIHTITDCELLEYENQKAELEASLNRYLEGEKRNLLISEECFATGSSLPGRVDRYTIAKRLGELFDKPKIIVTLREQKSIIRSYYLQKVKIDPGFRMSYSDWLSKNSGNQHIENVFQFFHYDRFLEMYCRFFGKENIVVLLYEEFLADKESFIRRLAGALDIDAKKLPSALTNAGSAHENPTVSKSTVQLNQLADHFPWLKAIIPLQIKNLLLKQAAKGEVPSTEEPEWLDDYIKKQYSAGNTIVSEKFDLPLRQFSYELDG